MNARPLFLAILALVGTTGTGVLAQTAAAPNEGSILTRDPATGAYRFSWWGRAGRTYFLQQSDDLLHWSYLPVIEAGADEATEWGFASSAPAFFVRLKPVDFPTSDPFGDDFDGDKVSNYDELLQGTDPLLATRDANGLPLDWETFYGLPVGLDANAPAPRGDGLTYLQAFRLGLNPLDFYDGHPPVLTLVSGDNQTGPAGGFVPLPLVVSVLDAAGAPFANAPVTFSVGQNGDLVRQSSSGVPAATLTVHTDSGGQAGVFFSFASADTLTSHVMAAIANVAQPAPVVFTEYPQVGGGGGTSPFAPTNFVSQGNPDGSLDMTWENHTDDQTPVEIQIQQADGTWKLVATLPPGTTSYHWPGGGQ